MRDDTEVSSGDVGGIAVSSGNALWAEPFHGWYWRPTARQSSMAADHEMYTFLVPASAQIKSQMYFSERNPPPPIETYGDGGVRLHKDRMEQDRPYSAKVGDGFLVFIRRADNSVDVLTSP